VVIDGDTLRQGDARFRLWGIDAPERAEAGGGAATSALRALVRGETLACTAVNTDRYGRTVIRCTLPDGRDLGCAMVQSGTAADWPKYSGGAYRGCGE
jgi:endonuclease YncB( thermonuclease family)